MSWAQGHRMSLLVSLFLLTLITFFPEKVTAATTAYRSASSVTTNGLPPFTNLDNCFETDGLTCDREPVSDVSFANLFFHDFGNFNLPAGSTITHVRLRVTGATNAPIRVTAFHGSSTTAGCGPTPGDRWSMWSLITGTTYTVTTPISNRFLFLCLNPQGNFTLNINHSGAANWFAKIDNLEVAFEYDPPAPPPPPEPFLDLPWDYEGKGMSFSTAATAINSYFDHEYPLLSRNEVLFEPIEAGDSVVTYKESGRKNRPYSSHDGYDYGNEAGTKLGEPLLAAAAGTATLKKSESGCGYMISIDHHNGYQTRYCHLNKDGYLVVADESSAAEVEKGQQIGEVGFTGRVIPAGERGSHLHFMVVHDKNGDGNFEDNLPDGLVDPFGWRSSDLDPWEHYTFDYLGLTRTGMKSHYLWTTPLGSSEESIPSEGKNVDVDTYNLTFPENVNNNQPFNLKAFITPIVSPSPLLGILGPGISIDAFDLLGDAITQFAHPFTITIDFAEIDLSGYDLSTISIYSSIDGEIWTKETGTAVDLVNKKASVEVDHLTEFVLMAERLDSTPPETEIVFDGQEVGDGIFKPGLTVSLVASDGAGMGVDYTVYGMSGGEWEQYAEPLVFSEEGDYELLFYSVDIDGNIEETQTELFSVQVVDETPPEIEIVFDQEALDFVFTAKDASGEATLATFPIASDKINVVATDAAGNTTTLFLRDKTPGNKAKMSISSLQYNNEEPVLFDNNKFVVKFEDDFDQKYQVAGETKIRLNYDPLKDRTKISTTEFGEERLVEIVPGMRFLQLYSEEGTLRYRY